MTEMLVGMTGRGLIAGARGGETVAQDLGDVRTSARKGYLIVYGKGGEYREIPLHPKLRTVLDTWRTERARWTVPLPTPHCSSTPVLSTGMCSVSSGMTSGDSNWLGASSGLRLG